MFDKIVVGAFFALLVKAIGGLAGYAATVVVARTLGASDAGYYFLLFAWVNVLAVVGRFGLDKVVLRYVSYAHEINNSKLISGIAVPALLAVAMGSLVVCLIIIIFKDDVTSIILDTESEVSLVIYMALSIPLLSMICMMSEVLQGLRRYTSAIFVLNISTSVWLILIISLIKMSGVKITSELTGIIWLTSCVSTVIAGIWLLKKELINKLKQYLPIKTVRASCFPLYVTDIMSIVVVWGFQIIAGMWVSESEMSQLAAAQRTSALISLILVAINVVTAPKFAVLYNEGRLDDLKNLVQWSCRVSALVALPIVGIMCVFPKEIMSVFGASYYDGWKLLPIMAAGQFINAISGSVVYLMAMTGHERDLRNVTILIGCVSIITSWAFVREYGVIGGAFSVALSLALLNIMLMYCVKKRLGFNMIKLSL